MCFSAPKTNYSPLTPTPVAAYDSAAAQGQADLEGRLRRMRAGAAADVLTSPLGIPAGGQRRRTTAQLGGVAQ